MPEGFEFVSETPNATEYYYTDPNDQTTRTTRPADPNMTSDGTTTTGEITQSNTEYSVNYTNK